MTIDNTVAKIGRSMKKWDIIYAPLGKLKDAKGIHDASNSASARTMRERGGRNSRMWTKTIGRGGFSRFRLASATCFAHVLNPALSVCNTTIAPAGTFAA